MESKIYNTRKNKFILLGLLLIISVGFAVLSTNLNITGNSVNNIDLAFQKDEMNLEGNIYKYDDELNHRIKKAINMVYTRSAYLKATSILILIIV